MGNYRFRLSDMMPNSWFYKLRDIGRSTSRAQSIHHHSSKRIHHHHKTTTPPNTTTIVTTKEANFSNQVYIPNRPSYYFPTREQTEKKLSYSPSHPKASDTHFPIDPPRKSHKKPRKKPAKALLSSASTYGLTSSTTDIIIDVKAQSSSPKGFEDEEELVAKNLPRIVTRPVKRERIKVRQSSPKVEVKKVKASRSRRVASSRRIAESFVVVKRSRDPRREFRESMVEMIIENEIRGSKDLEELLACYLSLNSAEYHDLIVRVFEEIWVDLTEISQL